MRDHKFFCSCQVCHDYRGDPRMGGEFNCFNELNGHGPCNDPHGVGCICTGTAYDGECEACWMVLK